MDFGMWLLVVVGLFVALVLVIYGLAELARMLLGEILFHEQQERQQKERELEAGLWMETPSDKRL